MTLVAPTRTLIVGSGGREHALAWKLASEPGGNEVIVAPGSDAIAAEPRVRTAWVPGVYPQAILELAKAQAVELVVIGPEAWLAAGTSDLLRGAGIPVFGPTAAAARVETSKAYCHELAEVAGVPMARAIVATTRDEVDTAVLDIAAGGTGFVLKEDGLASGKGVTVCGPNVDPRKWGEELDDFDGDLAGPMLIEERLEGREASVIAICDGERATALPPARDHKRLLDGDRGPNTGGMGAYSPLPDLDDDEVDTILDQFHRPILAELARRGTPFRGALYAGLMLTASGPRLLEFNARFGDPETQVIAPRLAGPIGPLLLAAARSQLPESVGNRMPVLQGATVGIVLAGRWYPNQPSEGDPIEGIDAAKGTGALIFHSGTRRTANGAWETKGGRILTVVGRGQDIAAARDQATSAAQLIRWSGLQRRRDIVSAYSAVGAAS